jgi:hypothetical protein
VVIKKPTFVGRYHPIVSSTHNYNSMGMLDHVLGMFPVFWAVCFYQYTSLVVMPIVGEMFLHRRK